MDETVENVTQLIHKTSFQTEANYRKMSGGLGITDSGIETYLSAKIAEALQRGLSVDGNSYWVSLEEKFSELFKHSGVERRGGLPFEMQGNKRVDVAVFRDEKPFFVVEVKRGGRHLTIKKDAERVASLLRRMGPRESRSGSLRFGVCTMLGRMDEQTRESFGRRIDVIRSRLEQSYSDLDVAVFSRMKRVEPYRSFKTSRTITDLGAISAVMAVKQGR